MRRAHDPRNRIASLLIDRTALVRYAARFVFRNHPEIARQSTIPSQTSRCRASRRATGREPPLRD
jgi:hypothetical protein